MKGTIAFILRRKCKQDQLLSSSQTTQDVLPIVLSNVNVKHEREQEETSAAKRRTFIQKVLRFAIVRQLHREASGGNISNASAPNLLANSGVKRQRLKAYQFAPLIDEDIKSERERGFFNQNSDSEESEDERKSARHVSVNKKGVNGSTTRSFFQLQDIRCSGRGNFNRSQFRRVQQENKSSLSTYSRDPSNFAFDNFGLCLETDDAPVPSETL
uniref:Uncharacterized protein n=1 Tax=Schistocephalus solidus TaxID=70667 RepID=A0A0X3PRY0_SCHSO